MHRSVINIIIFYIPLRLQFPRVKSKKVKIKAGVTIVIIIIYRVPTLLRL